MAVVTLSRQVGSGGDKIAEQVCDLLGYRYFDKQMIIEAAADTGLCEYEVVDFSEDSYKMQDFLARLFRAGPRTVKHLLIREPEHGPIETLTAQGLDESHCVDLVRRAVLAAHDKGDIVIVGRGGQAILHDKPGVLHLRVTAPFEQRVQWLRAQGVSGISEIKLTIMQKDRATAEYLKRFFGIEWDDPALYHMVINSAMLSPTAAAHVIAEAVRQVSPQPVA